jgi:S1-C subfamily serine protease
MLACAREAGSGCPYCAGEVALGDPIMVCQACGTVHHRACWRQNGRCGSYTCAPARRDLKGAGEPVLTISTDELDRAAPLPSARPSAFPAPAFVPRRSAPRTGTNRLAIAALVCGLVGIPFVGFATGLAAIVLGALALGAIRDTNQKGLGLAVSGVLLGIVDVVGWLAVLTWAFSHGAVSLEFADEFQPDMASLKELDPEIRRAMLANVLIERRGGLAALGGVAVGSGVILAVDRGEAVIVTNRHVVDPGYTPSTDSNGDPGSLGALDVKMLGQPVASGRVVWTAPGGIDLALVRVPCPASGPARAALWQKARPMKVGAPVFAIGNPHRLGWTHTQGVISQFRLQRAGKRQVRLIQTQAAINPGNSGGGLYDRDGYLIGINTLTQDKRVSEGISFAIALDTLLDLAPPDLAPAGSGESVDSRQSSVISRQSSIRRSRSRETSVAEVSRLQLQTLSAIGHRPSVIGQQAVVSGQWSVVSTNPDLPPHWPLTTGHCLIGHRPSVICHLPFAICHLPFVIHHLPSPLKP